MGWKNIKQEFCPDFDVYMDRQKGDILIQIESREIFRINTINFDVVMNPAFKTSNAANSLFKKLKQAKEELKRLFEESDKFENRLSVFTIRDNKIIKECCEDYGYGKPTYSGERISFNHFETRKDAERFLKASVTDDLLNALHYSFIDNYKKAFKGTWKLIKAVWTWIKVRIL